MEEKFRLIFIPIAAFLFLVISYQYVCPADSDTCHFKSEDTGIYQLYASGSEFAEQEIDEEFDLPTKIPSKFNFTERDLDRRVDFNIKGDDVIVFLHIQKTGGTTFGRHLVKNIRLEQPCDCLPGQRKCVCHRPGKAESWLFSRFSTGWSCGLHADWTELTNCVPVVMNKKDKKNVQKNKRNFYYITMLRDPVSRYLSEWKHVQRGATWKTALHMCDGRLPTRDELPACYGGEDWTGVTLAEFMGCPSNLADNRQARMLADLSLVGCYNMSSMSERERGRLLLASAKTNLRNMAFYGLTEFQRKTQFLFERTFGLRFLRAFTQLNGTRAASVGAGVAAGVRRRIEELNALDVELYEYARELFLRRYQYGRQRQRREERARRRRQRRRLRRTYLAELWRLGGWRAEGDGETEGEVERGGSEAKDGVTTEDYSSQVVRW